ncbi:hairy-related 8a [Triplophysa rosa]|uniref:Transcription factor Her-8b n=1 Tax=Triplophysa rosa TaxID=992332 RepID=A0A9W7X5Q3_TRIRA|nr:hairy-related 8a [Triplophysa rosa]KAI7814493.1 transcription factor Her-8b [Triplophysa rosa]
MTASNIGNGPEKNFNAKEERKLRKPLIEKKRRERINSSLEQLKGIMVDAYNLDQSKLEKADVLEITVQHMENLQRGNGAGSSNHGPGSGFESRQRYSTGYIQCMHEVHNLLLSCPGMDKSLGARLLNHLLKSLPHIGAEANSTCSTGTSGSLPLSPTHSPLNLPSLQAHPLHLHTPSSPPPPSSPSSPSHSPRIPLVRERSYSVPQELPSPPRSPSPTAQSALPPFFLGGDPSMWRPW